MGAGDIQANEGDGQICPGCDKSIVFEPDEDGDGDVMSCECGATLRQCGCGRIVLESEYDGLLNRCNWCRDRLMAE